MRTGECDPICRPALVVGWHGGSLRPAPNRCLSVLFLIGEHQVDSDIQLSFPLDRLDQPENFLSLLFYFGLLSIRDVVHGVPRLGIPNQTVKRLMYGYLRDAYDDVGGTVSYPQTLAH